MNWSYFSKTRYLIGVGSHTHTKITPKLPPTPPTPRGTGPGWTDVEDRISGRVDDFVDGCVFGRMDVFWDGFWDGWIGQWVGWMDFDELNR